MALVDVPSAFPLGTFFSFSLSKPAKQELGHSLKQHPINENVYLKAYVKKPWSFRVTAESSNKWERVCLFIFKLTCFHAL